ncbi:hypothetical protein KFE94_03295 [bacterium SCSIO 12643]|nr:hypothetical protein KFE94_03295 [bacterium SCSIO 12643]
MKLLISVIIAFIPFNKVRIFLYRGLLGFEVDYNSHIGMLNIFRCSQVKISNARIGYLNYINVEELILSNGSSIFKLNRLKSLNRVVLGVNSVITSKNFLGGPKKGLAFAGMSFKDQNVIIGEGSSILRSNYFDVVRKIKIGNNVVFGGNGSEIWTHGFDTKRNMLVGTVEFGNNIFIGSNCVFTKSIVVCDEVSIGPLSTVYKSISVAGVYSTHKLEKVK